jgi:gamma-glutamyl hercynylcysteine S-oxide hydrolase
MARFALHLGTSCPLADLIFHAPHALQSQARSPRGLHDGTVNVDGTGVVWWPDDHPEPLRYVTATPPWADGNLAGLASRLTGRAILAAVRNATPGIGYGADHVPPFVHGDLAVVHDGWIGAFRESVAATLIRQLPDDLVVDLPAVSDSRLLALAVLAHRREHPDDLAAAVGAAIEQVASVCQAARQTAALNLAVTDGRQAVLVRRSLGVAANSLYLCSQDKRRPGVVRAASEPLDDGPWRPLGEDTLTHISDDLPVTPP